MERPFLSAEQPETHGKETHKPQQPDQKGIRDLRKWLTPFTEQYRP
jgi:hypothetical protein